MADDVARRAIKRSAWLADRVRRPRSGIVVLIYHRVGAKAPLEIDLPEALFEEQMAALAATRRVVPLGMALDALDGAAPADGPPPVVVTFDDGTADFVDRALPILERYAIPVTLYVASAFIEDGTAFPADGTPASWAALADACTTGLVDVGSHTHGHTLLDRLPPTRVVDELDKSIDVIEKRLGQRPLDFAYPKAVPGSPAAEQAVRERFRSAALAGTRANVYTATDYYRLARSPVQRSDGMHWFRHKVEGGLHLEDDLRRAANRWRYRRSVR